MGFFGNLFKKKKGGSVIGNLWRGVKHKVIPKVKSWFGKKKKTNVPPQYDNTPAYRVGENVAESFFKGGQEQLQESDFYKNVESQAKENWLKNNWGYLAAGVSALIGGTYLFTNKHKR